jgi:hypothetical protein
MAAHAEALDQEFSNLVIWLESYGRYQAATRGLTGIRWTFPKVQLLHARVSVQITTEHQHELRRVATILIGGVAPDWSAACRGESPGVR